MNKIIVLSFLVLIVGSIPYSFATISMNGVHVTTQYGGDLAYDNKVNCWDSIWIYLTFQPTYLTCSIQTSAPAIEIPSIPEIVIPPIGEIIDKIPALPDFYIHPDDLIVLFIIGIGIFIIFLVMRKRRNQEVHVHHY